MALPLHVHLFPHISGSGAFLRDFTDGLWLRLFSFLGMVGLAFGCIFLVICLLHLLSGDMMATAYLLTLFS